MEVRYCIVYIDKLVDVHNILTILLKQFLSNAINFTRLHFYNASVRTFMATFFVVV